MNKNKRILTIAIVVLGMMALAVSALAGRDTSAQRSATQTLQFSTEQPAGNERAPRQVEELNVLLGLLAVNRTDSTLEESERANSIDDRDDLRNDNDDRAVERFIQRRPVVDSGNQNNPVELNAGSDGNLNGDDNQSDNDSGNLNVNDNDSNDNGNVNDDDLNTNVDDNWNDNVDDNWNDNVDDNGNDNGDDNWNDNVDDNWNDNDDDNGNDNDDDNGNDND
jgi:hypothetical protein